MLRKDHIESFLRVNKIPETASDEEIRQALLFARWTEEDIQFALLTLRNKGGDTDEVELTAGHGVLHSDYRPSPQALSSLLGLTVSLNESAILDTHEEKKRTFSSVLTSLLMLILAALVAYGIGNVLMYILGIGPYYSPL